MIVRSELFDLNLFSNLFLENKKLISNLLGKRR
jgi:hypothetical protein